MINNDLIFDMINDYYKLLNTKEDKEKFINSLQSWVDDANATGDYE